eukprot:TRINITY_DN64814_c0_g4_i2.p1 TRINITY_DN64814_c0_g4~~TRINITY_DN64814_c0_g4_i2.p1  ORF type:complete len:319 (+),score=19.17 TRINITY_DN64814_c0_g4_i2:75-1031(+)
MYATAKSFAAAVVIPGLVGYYGFGDVLTNYLTLCKVEGPSMSPTFNPHLTNQSYWPLTPETAGQNDVAMVLALKSSKLKDLQKGGVYSLVDPTDEKNLVVKRLVGLPGDKIISRKRGIIVVPPGHCWMAGDNPSRSEDSEVYGAIPIGCIRGVVSRVVWPLSRWGKIETKVDDKHYPKNVDPYDYDLCLGNTLACMLATGPAFTKADLWRRLKEEMTQEEKDDAERQPQYSDSVDEALARLSAENTDGTSAEPTIDPERLSELVAGLGGGASVVAGLDGGVVADDVVVDQPQLPTLGEILATAPIADSTETPSAPAGP